MTSAGANTWSVPLEINNLESQVSSNSGSGVTSIATSGAGLSTSGGTGNVTLTNTGVTSLVAGSNITLSGATGAVTITSTGSGGISAVSGGTAISTSTASGVVTVNNTGVTSLVAGSNITLSGGTGAVTINANTQIVTSTVIDTLGSYNITLTPAQLNNSLITSSVANANPSLVVNFLLPTYAQLSAVYSTTTYLQSRFVNVGRPYGLSFTASGGSGVVYYGSNVSGGTAGSPLVLPTLTLTEPFTLGGTAYWTLNTVVDKLQGQVQYYFEYAGQYVP